MFDESESQLSPDGRWMAYVSNESGMDQIYVRSFPQPGSVWQVSVNGGAHPRWRRDGRELLFVAPDGMLTAVDVSGSESFASGTPRMLLPIRGATGFAVEPRGRLLVTMSHDQDSASQLHVVVNWMAELSRP